MICNRLPLLASNACGVTPGHFGNLPRVTDRPSISLGMLRSLLLSRNDDTIRIVSRGFKDLEVELEPCSESSSALSRLVEVRFDAILLDDHVEDAHVVLERIVEFPNCGKSVRIVLAEPKLAMHATFRAHTQIVLYKPLSAERVRQGLRAVRNLMARERRRGSKRIATMLPARISPRHAKAAAIQVLLADISESGAAIRYENGDLPVTSTINLEFALPGDPERFHCLAELVWQDHAGSGGVRFVDMPSYSRQRLAEWVKEHEKQSGRAASAGGER